MRWTASSTDGMRNGQRGSPLFTPEAVRSVTLRTGHGVPSRANARRSDARVTMCMAEQTAPLGRRQTPASKAPMASVFSM